MGTISTAPQSRIQHEPPLGRLLCNRLPGNGRENFHNTAVAKSFFNLLKRERIRRSAYKTREDARRDVFDYCEMFYNPKRKHARNGMLSPVEFERQQNMKQEGV